MIDTLSTGALRSGWLTNIPFSFKFHFLFKNIYLIAKYICITKMVTLSLVDSAYFLETDVSHFDVKSRDGTNCVMYEIYYRI